MTEMTLELRARLLAQLAVRADRLAKMAAIDAPAPLLAMMAEHVATTSMLLFGDRFASAVIAKMVMNLRAQHDICLCGNGRLVQGQPLCRPCLDQVARDDRACREHLAMSAQTKGHPS